MPLLKRFVAACSDAPPGAAIVDTKEEVHPSELLRRSVALSLLLRQHDRSPDGHVGIFLPNVSAFPACLFGAMLAGRVAVPLNILLQPSEVGFILNDAKIHTVLTISMFKPLFEGLHGKLGWELNVVYLDELPGPPEGVAPPPIHELVAHEEPGAPAALLYTSGTTGSPKGVMLTYENLESNYEGSARVLEFHDHQDVVLGQLPVFHSYGLMATLICPILDQVKLVMLARFQPGQLLKTIVEHQISAIMLVAPMYGLLARMLKAKPTDLSFVRLCVSGGGPLPTVVEQGWKALTGLDILNGYGLTEASPVVANNAPTANRPGSIGRPLHNVEVQIRDADSGKTLGVGEEGEICVKAPSVMKGYHNRPEENAASFTADGLLRTGDLGRVDDDGYVWITGRAKDLIIFAGENIMPLEIENALVGHPAVAEAAVVGIPDPSKGEVPVAAIVFDEGQEATADDLRGYLKPLIADFKMPREFRFLEALPKNALNKVLKAKLVEQLTAG